MFFSKSCEYALRSVLFLASKTEGETVGIKVIASSLDIPTHFSSKIMQSLVKHGLVSSLKGKNGGFYLSNRDLDNPLIKVVFVIEGEDFFKKCGMGLKGCSDDQPCPIHRDVVELRDRLKFIFSNKSIREFGQDIISENLYLFR